MKNTNSTPVADALRPVSQGGYSHALRQSFRTILLAIQAGIFFASPGFACETNAFPLSDLPSDNYRIEVVSPQAGQLRIQLYAGSEPAPLQHLLGFDMEFAIGAALPPDVSAAYHPADSWTAEDGLFTASISLDPASQAVSLAFRRTDCQSVSGHGLLGEIVLEGMTEPMKEEDLVRLTAGLVLEEVVNGARVAPTGPTAGIAEMTEESGLRMASDGIPAPSEPQKIQAWPQPAGDCLHLRLPENSPADLYICDLTGRVLIERTHVPAGMLDLDLSSLPGGTYFLHSRAATGAESCQRICKY